MHTEQFQTANRGLQVQPSNAVLDQTRALEKKQKKNCTARTKHKAAVRTSFLRTGWLRTRLLALGVGAKRWSVKKQSKKRATIAASPWRTTAQPSLQFKAPPPWVSRRGFLLHGTLGVELLT